MSNEELRKASRLSVRRSESVPGWEAVTSFCCLGGCDMDVYPFPSERDALLVRGAAEGGGLSAAAQYRLR